MLARKKLQSRTNRRHKDEIDVDQLSEPVLYQVVASEAVLLLTIFVCTVIIWNSKVNVYGISYFGVKAPTLPVVALGFVGGGIMLIMASRKFPSRAPYVLVKWTLRIVSVGIVLLLLTPYTVDTFFNWTHMLLGAAIFVTELYTGGILCFRHMRDRISKWAFGIQFLGGLLAMFSLPDNMLNFMIEGEVIFQLGFMVILNHLLRTEPSMIGEPIPPEAHS